LVLGERALEVVLRDDGEPPGEDDLKPKEPSPDRPGGLGLHLMYECMDEVSYERLSNDRNQLCLVKYLK
jgi:anti-sigma regulatory factor (Ser/Thr protein kinase)